MKKFIKKWNNSFKKRINPIIPIWYLASFLRIWYKSLFSAKQECVVDRVRCLTFRVFAPYGGKGGGAGVLSTQKMILCDSWDKMPIYYDFIDENRYSTGRPNLWDIFAGAYFAIQKTKHESSAVYITHDYGTAFGLALMKKRYAMICHAQGPNLEERLNYGFKTNFWERKIVKFAESYAFRHATQMCFPSIGAREYYFKSKYRSCNKNQVKNGPIMYNTLYADAYPKEVEGLTREDGVLTFLSVGQLTVAKGIDRCVEFFDELLSRNIEQKIRYIVVGDGILADEIIGKIKQLSEKYENFSYVHYKHLSYNEISYVQDVSDIYIMLQRISIFDLATLEVMRKSKAIILSDIGGNPEFNKEDNIILYKNNKQAVDEFLAKDIKELGNLNKKVYDNFFSPKCFMQLNRHLINEIIRVSKSVKYNFPLTNEDLFEKNRLEIRNVELAKKYHSETFKGYKNKFLGKDVIIVASGPSINKVDYSKFPEDAICVGVNKSFLNKNIKLDYLFVQDLHPDQDLIDNYEGNNCQKFYALLPYRHLYNWNLRPITEDNLLKANAKRFVLEENINGKIALDIETEPFGDFKSTVFSIMQFILYTHPKRIYLLGCDCSMGGYAYGEHQAYLDCDTVISNWAKFKHFAKTYYPDTEIISVNPVGLKGMFKEILT
ncbi:MAG: glycosyltransferase [Candidatus Gastranaerophilaceae bacterium]